MRKIIHIDMDSFFASVEVKNSPELKGLPVAVGGPASRRGVVATASYEARKFGVRSAMPTGKAQRLCPDLVLIYPSFHLYKQESQKVFEIFKEYTNIIEPLSIDEAFLDVSESKKFNGSATKIAQDIREKIKSKTGLTASAGVASNKFLAKICSDLNKPNGQFTLHPRDNLAFTSLLPVEKIFGVGKKTKLKMNSMGINTCADLQHLSSTELQARFGKFGESLYKLCRGVDERPLKTSRQRKSFSVEKTFSTDLNTHQQVKSELKTVYSSFLERFKKSKTSKDLIKTALVKIKYFDFKSQTKEVAFKQGVPPFDFYLQLCESLWSQRTDGVRLLGLGVKLRSKNEDDLNLNLFED